MKKKLNNKPTFNIKDIHLIVYDFDGVFTDNKVLVFEDGKEAVFCNRADGWAVQKIKELGIPQIILSSEQNRVVRSRAKKLGLPVINNSRNKGLDLIRYCKRNKYRLKNVVYLGNDVNDLEAMRLVGHPVATQDAHCEIKKNAEVVLKTKGGEGVVRELFERLE